MSAPGQAGGDAGTTSTNGGDAQAQGQGPDLAGMVDQLGQIAAGQEEMRQYFASKPWQEQDAEPAAQPEEADLSFLDPYGTEDPRALQQTRQGLMGMVGEALQPYQQQMQQEISRLHEQQEEARRDQQARDLVAEFPELSTQEAAERLAGEKGLVQQWADELGERMGDPSLAARLKAEPAVWKLVHMAQAGADTGNRMDGSTDPAAASLEAGGGPGPAAQTNEDIVKGIMEAGGRGSKVLDFRT